MTVEEIKQKYGADFFQKIWQPTVISISEKPIINNFEEFDETTKNIYIKISQTIKSFNPNDTIVRVYATGSRVLGTWKNDEELLAHATANLLPEVPKPAYDFYTEASYIPSQEILSQFINGSTAVFNSAGHKILIP